MESHLTVALVLVCVASTIALAAEAPLRVANWADAARNGWPVTGGVPLPRGEVTDLSEIALLSDGEPVAVQLAALAHWDNGSIKWVLVDFPADITAGEACDYSLRFGDGASSAAAAKEAPLTWERTDEGVAIDTGAIRATTGPRLIHELSLRKGDTWVQVMDAPGDLLVSGSGTRAGEFRSSLDPDPEIEVEEAGPQRICVRVKGWHRNEAGERFVAYVLRVHAFAGKPWLKVQHTFINSEFPEDALITGVGVEIPVGNASQVSYGGVTRPAAATGSLRQTDWNVRKVIHDGEIIPWDSPPESYLAVRTDAATVSCALRDMDHLYPKELAFSEDGLTVWMWPPSQGGFDLRREEQKQSEGWLQFKSDFPGLFEDWCDPGTAPSAGISAHRYRAAAKNNDRFVMAISNAYGLARTHEFWLNVQPPDVPEQHLAEVAACVREPLLPFADPHYMSATQAMGRFGWEDREGFPRSENYIRHKLDWLMHHQNEWHRWWGILDWGGTRSIYERYGNYEIPGEWWKYLGRHGWHNSEVEIPCYLMYEYLRTGERKYWHLFECTQRHQMDVDTIHLNLPEYEAADHEWKDRQWIRGGQHRHSYNHYSGGANTGHSWNEGLAWYYLLTGDRRALNTAIHVGEYSTGSPITPAPSVYERRVGAKNEFIRDSMLCYKNALTCYMITGDELWREVAMTWRRHFLDNPRYIDEARPTYQITTYMIHSLALDWNLFHHQEVADEIVRIARWHCDFIEEGYEERGLKYPFLACGLAWWITRDDELLSWPWYRYLEREAQSDTDTVQAPDDFMHGWFYEYGQLPFFLRACAEAGYTEANPPPRVELPEK